MSLDRLQGHTIRKTIEMDGRTVREIDMDYHEYVEELADLLYDKVACGYNMRFRWTKEMKYSVNMPTHYPCAGVVWRYKIVA